MLAIGAGYLDVQNALTQAFSPPPSNASMNSPVATYDSASGNVYFVSDQHALWGSSTLWDSHALWGANVFIGSQSALWGSSALRGSHALWGSSTNSAFSALWGSHALWGATSSDATEALSITANGEN